MIVTNYTLHNDTVSFQKRIRDNQELADLSRKYTAKNPPPSNILNIGLHGSSNDLLDLKHRPFSDIDFFCIADTHDKNSINYLNKFIRYFNKKAGTWVDMMLGETQNNDFKLGKFNIDNLQKENTILYGDSFEQNLNELRKNVASEDPIIDLFQKTQNSGLKFRKGLLLINDKQTLVSFPAVAMRRIKVKPALKNQALTLSKSIVTSCSFANSAMGYLNGKPIEYSKKKSPEMLKELFGIDSEIAKTARGIYCLADKKADLKKFIEEDAFEWLKTQKQIEEILLAKMKQYAKSAKI